MSPTNLPLSSLASLDGGLPSLFGDKYIGTYCLSPSISFLFSFSFSFNGSVLLNGIDVQSERLNRMLAGHPDRTGAVGTNSA